ncbi:hypothetical protein [Chamaesiphon sp.]|uniref:hypothetical protein n=1 Tax=Chamaesiphon sp. TaxID=2814140 RepID=UPI003593ED9B
MIYTDRIKAERELAVIFGTDLDQDSWEAQISRLIAQQQREIIWCNRMLVEFPEEEIAIRHLRSESISKITGWCKEA